MQQHNRGTWQGHQAADSGVPDAQYERALLYSEARGAERDWVMAYKWAKLAAFQGHVKARQLQEKLRKEMTLAEVQTAERLAVEFRPASK